MKWSSSGCGWQVLLAKLKDQCESLRLQTGKWFRLRSGGLLGGGGGGVRHNNNIDIAVIYCRVRLSDPPFPLKNRRCAGHNLYSSNAFPHSWKLDLTCSSLISKIFKFSKIFYCRLLVTCCTFFKSQFNLLFELFWKLKNTLLVIECLGAIKVSLLF